LGLANSAFLPAAFGIYCERTNIMNPRLYQIDSYMREFNTEVVEHDAEVKALALAQTAFYPGGGGQPCDTGWLIFPNKKLRIWQVKVQNRKIWHYYKEDFQLTDIQVQGKLDWARRYDLMRTHTAMHILSAVAWQDYQVQVTGGNMDVLQGHLDFEFETLSAELIESLEMKINREVKEARRIEVKFLTREQAEKIPDLIRTKVNLLPANLQKIRVVEIEGLDLQADGGTHVKNTAEVGQIAITGYKSKGKNNKRIKIALKEEKI
jgi:misacylated tRNA(Ala) deacylase